MAGRIACEISVDSTTARAHQHAAGARSAPAEGVDRRSRARAGPTTRWDFPEAGFTTKIQLACEQGQNVMALLLMASQRGDSPQLRNVLEKINVPRIGAGRPRKRPARVQAGNAYSSRANRACLRRRGITATISEPANQTRNRKRRARLCRYAVCLHIAIINDWLLTSLRDRSQDWAHPAGSSSRSSPFRWEIRTDIHEAFLKPACEPNCWRRLTPSRQNLLWL